MAHPQHLAISRQSRNYLKYSAGPGTLRLYLATPDSEVAHNQLKDDGASQIADDPYGPGSGVKWFSVDDPESNHWMIVQETKRDGHES